MNLNNYNTDKFNLGYIDYIYNDLFKDRLEDKLTLLEIGVWNGESIRYWRDLFKNGNIYALDIHFCDKINNEKNIKHIVGNAYSFEINNLFDPHSIDIIIDDGPHTLESFVYLIENYIDKLKIGGLMIIEDIINTSWTPQLINLINKQPHKTRYTIHDMRNKQKTRRLLKRWTNGLDVLVIERI